MHWHVQRAGTGPVLLLLHGTGAATHTWRDLVQPLARHFTVIAPDLPAHGFSGPPPTEAGYSMPGMAGLVSALLRTLTQRPDMVAGHSAGAAVLARMCLDGAIAPKTLVSINGALLPLPGMPVPIFTLAARLLASTSVISRAVAHRANDPAAILRLLGNTGSRLDAVGSGLYQRLLRDPDHIRGVLNMMGNWDLRALERDLPKLRTPTVLVTGGNDRTVQPSEALRVRALLRWVRMVEWPTLGHLAHEEAPEHLIELLARGIETPELGSGNSLPSGV